MKWEATLVVFTNKDGDRFITQTLPVGAAVQPQFLQARGAKPPAGWPIASWPMMEWMTEREKEGYIFKWVNEL